MRSETTFQNTQKAQFIKFFEGMEQNFKDDPYTKEAKVLGRNEKGMPNLMYWRMKMTGMSDRDSVISMDHIQLDDGRDVFITKSEEHPDYPVTKKIIRLEMYTAGHCYQEGDALKYTEFAYFDMKGWFPTRLLNLMIGQIASSQMKTMCKKMREM